MCLVFACACAYGHLKKPKKKKKVLQTDVSHLTWVRTELWSPAKAVSVLNH